MAQITDSFHPLKKKYGGYQYKNLSQNRADVVVRMKLTLGVTLLATQELG